MSTAFKWLRPAQVYDAPHRPDWWDAWVAHLAGISADPYDPRRENEVWRWYEALWLQDPHILEEIGTRAARGVAGQCEEAKARGYASLSVWRLAVAEEARLAEARQRVEAEAANAAYSAERAERLARNAEAARERWMADAPGKRRRLPGHAAWAAWLFAAGGPFGNGMRPLEIGDALGVSPSVVDGLIRRYVEAWLPEAIEVSAEGWRVPRRREVLRAHFKVAGAPPEAAVPPKASMALEGRNRWVWLERQRGQTFKAIAVEAGVSLERCRQIYAAQERKMAVGTPWARTAAGINWHAARQNLGRPLDMGGPRDRWLVYEPWTPEGI